MATAQPDTQPATLPPAPRKRRWVITALMVLAALALGGGAATAWFLIKGTPPAHAMARAKTPSVAQIDIEDPMTFVDVQRLMVPLYLPDGTLVQYVSVDLALEVRSSDKDRVQQRLAPVRHAINRLTGTTDLRDPAHLQRLDYDRAARLMLTAANTALGTPAVHAVSIVNAMPI